MRSGIPDGIPVGRALDLPPRIFAEDLYDAVRSISQVHGDGILPIIPVFLRYGMPVRGTFLERDGAPIAIQIKADARHRGFALLHEVGHFLDLAGLGTPGEFTSGCADTLAVRWRQAIEQSDAVRQLEPLISTLVSAVPDEDIEERRTLRGFLGPEEIWARSYAQYIALQSGEPILLGALDALRTPIPETVYYPMQWNDADFLPISEAIGSLFRRIGWRA